MNSKKNSFLDFRHFEREDLISLFQAADQLRQQKEVDWKFQGTAALLFFENSTRTRMSFESACWRVGLGPVLLDANSGSSLTKGETPEDTIYNIAAMDPKLMIIRCNGSLDLEKIDSEIKPLIVNAGWGAKAHPSQALLDLYTLWRERELRGSKMLIVGDILHSRVASSHFEVFSKMGVQVAACGPAIFKPKNPVPGLQWFDSLKEGLEWCDVVMALRLQTERHGSGVELDAQDYHAHFGLNKTSLKTLNPNALIMHPGPVNRGVELADDVFQDSRCRIFDQVNCGLYVRTALLKRLLV
ncbi:MAG: aspartate carbamoyltransferase [Pseudomonadota bacterium]|jgi:aspartate carbamoyltransferase catalytic subunit